METKKTGKMSELKNTNCTKILREEYFGAVLYDREKISYRFLNNHETGEQKNSEYVEFRKLNHEEVPKKVLSAPIRVYWEITRKCDRNCPQCFTLSGKPVEHELSFEDSLKFIHRLREDNIIELRITGGEPTLKKGWEEIIRLALDIGLVVTLNTHGSYDDERRKKIAGLKPDQVIVSLDGPMNLHNSTRGENSFNLVLGTIKYLSEKKIPVRVNTLLTKDILSSLEEIIRIIEDYAVELCFMQLKPIGRGGKLLENMPTIQEIYMADEEINLLRKKYPYLKISTSYDIISEGSVMPAPDLDLTACAAGLRGCNIDSTGDIYACGFLEELGHEFKLGNIKDDDFSVLKTWYNSKKLKKFREQNLKKSEKCKSCSYIRNPCFGSCIVMDNYKELKSLNKKDPYCYKDVQ